ncbi:MAG: hypothetical protein NT069_01095, partial [Planctomycetota bacterium]|nr:hypothetical protein [Planctomycetota bacterium]
MIDWLQRPESSRVMALIRMGVGLLVLYDVLATWRSTVELYSTAGPAAPMFALPVALPPIVNSPTPDLADLAHRATGEFHPTGGAIPSPLVAVIAQSLLIFTSLCVVIGWRTRISLLLTFLLVAWLRPLD